MTHARDEKMGASLNKMKLTISQQANVDIASGFFTGLTCAGLFNPWDKALFLSVKHRRPFLSRANFSSPYQSFLPTMAQRALQDGNYFIFQGQLRSHLYPYLRYHLGANEYLAQFCIGMLAGSFSGITTNSISAIKYHTWGQEGRSFITSAREMWQQGGLQPFLKGTVATMSRDATFGSTYEVLRTMLNKSLVQHKNQTSSTTVAYLVPMCNLIAAGVATIIARPFAYARAIQYATSPNVKSASIRKALVDVWQESKKYRHQSFGRIRFFQQQFTVGWGAARSTVGMAAGQQLFDWSREKLSGRYNHK